MPHAYLIASNNFQSLRLTCSKKVFDSRAMAQRALRNFNKNHGLAQASRDGNLNTYRCNMCGSWHLGNLPTKGKR